MEKVLGVAARDAVRGLFGQAPLLQALGADGGVVRRPARPIVHVPDELPQRAPLRLDEAIVAVGQVRAKRRVLHDAQRHERRHVFAGSLFRPARLELVQLLVDAEQVLDEHLRVLAATVAMAEQVALSLLAGRDCAGL